MLFKQALDLSQSELVTHSGRQPVYGSPKYSGRQEHDPAPLRSLQIAFAPHGDGLQGLRGSSMGTGTIIKDLNYYKNTQYIIKYFCHTRHKITVL